MTDGPNLRAGWKTEDEIICMHLCISSPAIWSVIFQVLHFQSPLVDDDDDH